MAGWSSSSRRRSVSSAVHITSPLVSRCSVAAAPSSPSPISIRGVTSNAGYRRSPSAIDAPDVTVSSKTTRLTIHGAATQSPTPRDLARQRRALGPRRPSCASSERIVLRALPAARRRSSTTRGPVSRLPSLGSVPELCESPGMEQFEERASPPAATALKTESRQHPRIGRASLRLLARRRSLQSSIESEPAASLSTTSVHRSSSKVLRFD